MHFRKHLYSLTKLMAYGRLKVLSAGILLSFVLFDIPGAFANPKIDSLLKVLSYSKNDTNKVWVLRDLAYYHMEESLDSALIYSQKGYVLARNLDFVQGQIWNLYQKALALEFKDDFEEAMNIYNMAYTLAQYQGDLVSMAKLNNAMGASYYFRSDFGKAVGHFQEALTQSDEALYREGSAHALNNLGIIYRHRRNFKKAMETYQRSLAIKTAKKDTVGMVNSLYNLGLLYSFTQEYEESLEHFAMAESLSFSQQETRNQASIAIGLGVAHYNLEQFDSAKEYLANGLLELKSDNVHEKAAALAYLGIIKIRQGLDNEGLADLLEAKSLTESTERLELKKQVYKELATAYELLGQPDQAVVYWKSFNTVNDSINSEQRQWAFEEMQARFEAIEKDKTIKKQESALAEEKSRNLVIVVALSLLFFLTVFIGYSLFKKWRSNHLSQLDLAKAEVAANKIMNGRSINFDTVNRKLLSPLTCREKDIILLVDQGKTNHEIAETLFVSENTVKTHLKNIFSKTEAQNRTDLLHKLRDY